MSLDISVDPSPSHIPCINQGLIICVFDLIFYCEIGTSRLNKIYCACDEKICDKYVSVFICTFKRLLCK